MDLRALCQSLCDLMDVFGSLNELDWFHTLGNNVDYGKKKYEDLVKPKVDHVIGGLSILYLFAIFETYFDNSYWRKYIEPENEKILRAYRHVRHSIAHGHHGTRAQPRSPRGINQIEYDAFDEAVDRELFSPKNIIELDRSDNTFTVDPAAGIYLRNFMRPIIQDAVAKVAKETGI